MKYSVELILQDNKTIEIEADNLDNAWEKVHKEIAEESLDVGYNSYLISSIKEVK